MSILNVLILASCATREGVDIDDPEIASAYRVYQEALGDYQKIYELGNAWVDTEDILRDSYQALVKGEVETSRQFSFKAKHESSLALKQYEQQYQYANVFDRPIRCATYYPELDCPGYAEFVEQFTQAEEQTATVEFDDGAIDGVDPVDEDPFPEEEPIGIAPAPQAVTDEEQRGRDIYIVNRGDNLWRISAKPQIYGNPFRWPLIFKANADKIKDADLIFPKQKLNIFRAHAPGEVSRAVAHARSRGAWVVGGDREWTDEQYLAE